MRPVLPRLPPLLTGRARRGAAALCFALALLTSLPSSSHSAPVGIAVPPGLVATSAAVYADAASFVHPGDRIDLVETADATSTTSTTDTSPAPVVVAHSVQVLSIRVSADITSGSRTAVLLVAAPSAVAVDIAAHQGDRVLAAISAPP